MFTNRNPESVSPGETEAEVELIPEIVTEVIKDEQVDIEHEPEAEAETVLAVEPQWRAVLGGPLQGRELLINLAHLPHRYQEMWEGSYDAFLYEALGDLTTLQGATIWDVGSHIGYHALTFAELVGPSGHVVAFEPNASNVEQIRAHLQRNEQLASRITLLDFALGDIDGESNFIFSPAIETGESSGSHLEQAHAPELTTAYALFSQTNIWVARADTLLQAKRIPPPSLIKLDVEGAEYLVLSGAKQLLINHRPLLLIEVHHILAMHELLHLLLSLGYQTRVLQQAPITASRCFIVAQPNQ